MKKVHKKWLIIIFSEKIVVVWKHTMVTPFGVSHCTNFQGCVCLNVSYFKLLKDYHNVFAYYVRI
jgi:hypothetical protein